MASSEGTSVADALPLPTNVGAAMEPENKHVAHALNEKPTGSHALAVADHDIKGAAQQDHDGEVKDLGWNEPKEKIASPLVGGLPNEDLWVLVRRFNKVSDCFCNKLDGTRQ